MKHHQQLKRLHRDLAKQLAVPVVVDETTAEAIAARALALAAAALDLNRALAEAHRLGRALGAAAGPVLASVSYDEQIVQGLQQRLTALTATNI